MSPLDWIITVSVLVMGAWGFRQGLIAGFLSMACFAVGALIGSRLVPLFLADAAAATYGPVAALVGALVVGGTLAAIGDLVGYRLQQKLPEALDAIDGAGGAILIACLALSLVWVIAAAVLHLPGAQSLREQVQQSSIIGVLNTVLPPSGPLLNALDKFDPFPTIQGPNANVAPPPKGIGRDAEIRAAAQSMLRVTGEACGSNVQGSAWITTDNLIVTNAHVVAGQSETFVQLGGVGEEYDTELVWFDERNDLAILRAAGLPKRPQLLLDIEPKRSSAAAILGFPQNGPYTVTSARVGEVRTFLTQDAYGRGGVRRDVLNLRGQVRPGNSGGPVMDREGEVLGAIFAADADNNKSNSFAIPSRLIQDAITEVNGPVDAGPCVG